jgi:hypothetical protein
MDERRKNPARKRVDDVEYLVTLEASCALRRSALLQASCAEEHSARLSTDLGVLRFRAGQSRTSTSQFRLFP